MRNWLEISLDKLKENLNIVRSQLPEGCDIIAVVKANAYGHGEKEIARALERSCGIRYFAVASLGEAKNLRSEGVCNGEILVLSYVSAEELKYANEQNITLAAISMQHAMELSNKASELGIKAKVHIKLNTGMNRVGFECKTQKDLELLSTAYALPNLDITGIFSHFSSSDDLSDGADEYTKLQLSRFENTLSFLESRGINPGLRHISNSGAIGKYPNARFDAVRCGALMYGYNTAVDAKLPVKPIACWKASISCVRTLEKGDAVSYSRHFIAKGGEKIATICVGYADGYKRSLSGTEDGKGGCVIIGGKRCRILGNICMDQMMVDVTGVEAKENDVAILMNEDLDADELALYAGTCMHDILASIGPRVEREASFKL